MHRLMTSILSSRSYSLVGGTLKLISGMGAAASALMRGRGLGGEKEESWLSGFGSRCPELCRMYPKHLVPAWQMH